MPELSAPQGHLKRSKPSLIGGIFSGIVVFAIWLLYFGTGSIGLVALGLVLSAALGIWIRLADL
jgi:uncharacterized membrane protein (UPF0136 family)